MKVLHITYTTSGGAGIAVLRLHEALLSQGIESKILVGQTNIDSDNVVKISETTRGRYVVPNIPLIKQAIRALRRKGKCMTRMEKMEYELAILDKKYPAYFDLPLSSYEIESHPLIDWADVINIHWVSGFIDFPSFFSAVKKPIFWTMHDLNPFFGGFHHIRLREKYNTQYSKLENTSIDIKKNAISSAANLSLIALSSEMERLMKGHDIYKEKAIYKIHNCVDPTCFKTQDKMTVRQLLAWPENSRVLLFVNKNMNDSEKGLVELVEALNSSSLENILLVCVGNGKVPKTMSHIKVRHYNSVNDTTWLNLLYSATDFLVQPSHQEAFPLTPIEAMCCGTPVIITPVSGAEDMINERNGVIAEGYKPSDISKAITLAFKKEFNPIDIRENTIRKFSPQRIADQYIEAYKQAIN